MRSERALAQAALVLGLLSLLVAAGLAAAQGAGPNPGYFLVAGAALLLAGIVLDPSAVLALGRTRRGRSGSFSVAMAVAVLGALFFANVLAARGFQHLDLTGSQQHTLTPKTLQVLSRLRSDLDVVAFYAPSDPDRSTVQDLLGLYQEASPRVHVRFADPSADPAAARSLGVESEGSIALGYADRKPAVLGPGSTSEQDVTGAVVKLELNRSLTLCWAVGEGERDLESSDPALGYSSAAGALSGDGFTARQLDLSLAGGVPTGCDVVAVVGPHAALSAAAVKALQAYEAGGGRLLVATDPWRDAVNASLNSVLQPAGLKFDGGMVIEDQDHSFQNPAIPFVVAYSPDSPITKGLANQASVFPATTSVSAATQGAPLTALASSSSGSYEVASQRQNLGRSGSDKGGPFAVLAGAEQSGPGGKLRVVAVGTSAFAENQVLPPRLNSVNLQLFLASLDWLAGEDALISLPPKPDTTVPLALSSGEIGLDFFLAALLLPLLVVAGGFVVWLRRRSTPAPAA